ncbi:MAG: hypothetical protein Q9168_002492 [Polycauliona sp. 1 TL-2023]
MKFAAGYFQKCAAEGKNAASNVKCQSVAAIFVPPAEGQDQSFACIDKPVYRNATFADKDRPSLPQDIKFEGGGRKDCEYKRTGDDDPGWMKCGQDEAIKCQKEEIKEHDCKDYGKDEVWRTQLTCEFNSFEGNFIGKRGLEATSMSSTSLLPVLPKASSMDGRHDLLSSALGSPLEPRREAPRGKIYNIGYFEYQNLFNFHASTTPYMHYSTEAAIFVYDNDPFAVCKKTPQYISTRSKNGAFPTMPQNFSFKDQKNRPCLYSRKESGGTGTLWCQGLDSAGCAKEKVVAMNCAKSGKDADWKLEATCFFGNF